MFGLEYVIALIKVLFNAAFAIIVSIPFAWSWNALIPIYFNKYIPSQFLHIPFWHMVGLLLIIQYVGESIQKLTPKIVSIDQTSNSNNK